ncbi:MAG: hypothetical protein KDK78_04085 [Chlamydiia bacterium]|nr:hypothetical protein [Chlamydiia bacterium]
MQVDLGSSDRFPDTYNMPAFQAAAVLHMEAYPGSKEVVGSLKEGNLPPASALTQEFCQKWFSDETHVFSKCVGITQMCRKESAEPFVAIVAPNALEQCCPLGDKQVLVLQVSDLQTPSHRNRFFEIAKEGEAFTDLPQLTDWDSALEYMKA